MKTVTMKAAALFACASALSGDQLRRLRELNALRKDGAFSDAEYAEHKKAVVHERRNLAEDSPRRSLAGSTSCIVEQLKGMDQKAAAGCASNTVSNIKRANNASVNSILSYISRTAPTATLKGSGSSSGKVTAKCQFKHTCKCEGGGIDGGIQRATCSQKACFNEWYVFDNARDLKCQGSKCDPDRDNYTCCAAGRWLNKGTYVKISSDGKTATHSRQGDWDSARASPWVTVGKISVMLKVKVMKTYMMIGAIRKDGVQWNNHVHSSKIGDSYPDGWVWYSAGNSFYNYVPLSGTFKRWGGPNVFRTNNKVRIYVDADNKQVFIYCNGTQVASWSNCKWGQGVSVGASFYDNGSALEIMTQTPGQDNGWGAWREWGSMMERKGKFCTLTSSNQWESARASPWVSTGRYTVTFKATMKTYMMLGCFRQDYMNYEQHMHGSSAGDIYSDGWVWYAAGGRFYNYAPYGGSFKRVSGATNAFKNNEFVRVRADANDRACYVYWSKDSTKSMTLIAQWTNLNIGRGIGIGISVYEKDTGMTIVEDGPRNGSQTRSACGTDACLNGWTPHDNARELYCKGAECNPDTDNQTCCHIGKWLNMGTNLKVAGDQGNIIVHMRQGDWDSARASAWITTGRQSVVFKVNLMKTYMMVGAIRKDGVQWNNHVHSSKIGDSYPDGWVWYSAGNSFYNYVPLSGSFRRWGGPNVFRTGNRLRVYVDATKKQVFIFCNGTQVASWSNCSWGQGVSVGASFYDAESSLEIVQNTPGNDKGFGAWREWGMMMEREGSSIVAKWGNQWESARATEWISKGSRQVTMKVVRNRNYGMTGCYRKEYMTYEQHPHSGNVGDIHPEGWVWYNGAGRFYNYSPYGGTFRRMSNASHRFYTNEYIRIKADASTRACYVSWRKSGSGGFTLIAQWTNLNVGHGIAVGVTTLYVNDNYQIMEEK